MPNTSTFSFISVFALIVAVCAADGGVLYQSFIIDAAERRATCNDGSPPAYYLKVNPDSKDWVVYLQGGGGCYDKGSCDERFANDLTLMTSKTMGATLAPIDVLSSDCTINPGLCSFSVVYIHYCTSDWWSGNHSAEESGTNYNFFGRQVVQAVVEDVMNDKVNATVSALFRSATRVILAGSSAGGVGTFQHTDRLGAFLREHLPVGNDLVFGSIPDCGWFLAGPGYREYPCTGNEQCNVQYRYTHGSSMWGLTPNDACADAKGEDNKWECLNANTLYPYVKEKTFPFFFLTDMWQAGQDGINLNAVNSSELDWMMSREKERRQYIEEDKMESYFGVGCLHHVMFTSNYYYVTEVDGVSPARAIQSWLESGMKSERHIDSCTGVGCNKSCP